jgi:quinoprotein glucose dehydrogenase
MAPDGLPGVKPPWGTLNAIDLNTGRYLWTVPLGEYPALVEKGVTNTGAENYGGPVVTAGGLVFIGATRADAKFRAFDAKTGKVLWETRLPAAGAATPATYSVGGKQYVVIRAGATYVAYALP